MLRSIQFSNESSGEGDFMDEKIFVAFARYETRLKEYERARTIYKYALDSFTTK